MMYSSPSPGLKRMDPHPAGGFLEVEANLAYAGLNSNHVGKGGRTVRYLQPLHCRQALVQHRGHTPAPSCELGRRYCAVIPKVAVGKTIKGPGSPTLPQRSRARFQGLIAY